MCNFWFHTWEDLIKAAVVQARKGKIDRYSDDKGWRLDLGFFDGVALTFSPHLPGAACCHFLLAHPVLGLLWPEPRPLSPSSVQQLPAVLQCPRRRRYSFWTLHARFLNSIWNLRGLQAPPPPPLPPSIWMQTRCLWGVLCSFIPLPSKLFFSSL